MLLRGQGRVQAHRKGKPWVERVRALDSGNEGHAFVTHGLAGEPTGGPHMRAGGPMLAECFTPCLPKASTCAC